MRLLALAAILLVTSIFFYQASDAQSFSLNQNNYSTHKNYFSNQKIQSYPLQYLREAVKNEFSLGTASRLLRHLSTYRGYEAVVRQKTEHNPLVFRQGGIPTPKFAPTAIPIPGPPFDIPTPTGIIPGCLNLLCPPPQGALWVAGTCWCTP